MLEEHLPSDVRVSRHPVFGTVLITSREYQPGDVVISEAALVYTSEHDELVELVSDAHDGLGISALVEGREASLDFSMQLLAYQQAGQAVQALVKTMFTPDTSCSDSQYVSAIQSYVDQVGLLASQPPTVRTPSAAVLQPCIHMCAAQPEEAIQVLLVWVCNSYVWSHGGCAILAAGSLINHSCCENTRYRVVEGDADKPQCTRGCFFATRHIAVGDMITTNYLGYDEFTMLSTPQRQCLLLRTKMFTCTCDRCVEQPDSYRAIPCPTCQPIQPPKNTGQADYLPLPQSDATPMQPGEEPPPTDLRILDQHSRLSCQSRKETARVNGIVTGMNTSDRPSSNQIIACEAACQGYIVHHPVDATQTHSEPCWVCDSCDGRFDDAQVALWLQQRVMETGLTCDSSLGFPSCSVSQAEHFSSLTPPQQQIHDGLLHDILCKALSAATWPGIQDANGEDNHQHGHVSLLELELEEVVHNLQTTCGEGVNITVSHIECVVCAMLQVFGQRHWTVNSLRVAMIGQLAADITASCHKHLDAKFVGAATNDVDIHDKQSGAHEASNHDMSTVGMCKAPVSQHENASTKREVPVFAVTDMQSSKDLAMHDVIVDAQHMILKLCELLTKVWHYVDCHTKDDPAVVLKSVVGPATTALLAAVQTGLCDDVTSTVKQRTINPSAIFSKSFPIPITDLKHYSLNLAARFASYLVQLYESQPWYNSDGLFGLPEARRVHHLCTSMLSEHI